MNRDYIFWQRLDSLLERSKIVIDRPKWSAHPRYTDIVYKLDYGYLEGVSSTDGEGLDVWLGSDPAQKLNGVICTVDLDKCDAELKLLVGCTAEDLTYIESFYNDYPNMGAKIICRE